MTLRKPITFETTFSRYSADAVIGEGGAGRVYRATDDSDSKYAIKVLDPTKATSEKLKRFKNELLFCQRNQHPNILTVIDHGILLDGKKHSPFYVMPLYASSLRVLLQKKRISSPTVLVYFGQLLDGVEAAHLQKVIHRDLKPENVLYDAASDRLIIADFGVARFEEETLYTLVETAPNTRLANFLYSAPEQRVREAKVDQRADIYALGLILNEMYTGEVPQGTAYKLISQVVPEYGYLDDLVAMMLRQSSSERLEAIEAIKQQLIARKNEFITRQRISELKQTAVPITDIDDPLISDPPRLIGFDWDRGQLTLQLSRPVDQKWVWALQNMGGHTSLFGKGPECFAFSGEKARIDAEEHQVQQIIDYFKRWLPTANQIYEQRIRRERREEEEKQRQQFQRELEEQERRERVLKSVKI